MAERPIRIGVQLQPQHAPDYGQIRDAESPETRP